MSTYKALRKNPSAPQADAEWLMHLRDLPLAAPSDNMPPNPGCLRLLPDPQPRAPTRAGPRVTARR